MEVLKAVKNKVFSEKDQMKIKDQETLGDLNVSTENGRPKGRKVFYSIIITCLSTFFFGFFVSSSEFFITNFKERAMIINNVSFMDNMVDNQMMCIRDNSVFSQIMVTMDNSIGKHNVIHMNDSMGNDTTMETTYALTKNEEFWFISIIFLGALFGNIVISGFHLNRKMVIMINNFIYLFGGIVMYYSNNAASLLIGKFILGVASGISFAYVPAYLTELKFFEIAGIIGSFPSLFVTLGIICGHLFEMYFHDQRFLGFLLICIFILAHSVYLVFILNTKSTKNGKNIKSLFKNRDSWKSVIMCCIFHLAQQASGVKVNFICASIIQKNTNKNRLVLIGLSQLLPTITAMSLVEILGRKILMILSVTGVILSLSSIIAFSHFIELGMHIFMIFFSLGLGPITWFITGELVPLEYRNATNQIATSMNWLSAFIAVWIQDYLFTALGINMFAIYLSFMCIYLIYLIVFFEETKYRITPSFL